MWTYSDKRIREGKTWTDSSGVTHPGTWSRWTEDEKKAKGLVWVDPPASYDRRFYYSAGIPKPLDDVLHTWSQEDIDSGFAPEGTVAGDAKLDEDGIQLVTKGLKTLAVESTKSTAHGLLAPSDWYILRNHEDNTAVIPEEVSTYRAAIRAASNTIEDAINAVVTLEDFIQLHVSPVDENGDVIGVPPISAWPTPI